ncbi:MAG: hybrid sensor histidine kinase/response regulator [Culturomica sp.]|jgi:two-component system sensor histidine kinase/response regulator|nr:hybrid sensor histidine kinase/response regulator [Culturomica sp.]
MQIRTLLLIGSHTAVFSKVKEQLEQEGIRTLYCKQLSGVPKCIQENQPDLIILHPGRKTENPCHTLLRIRKISGGKELPVILVFSAQQEKLLGECPDVTYTDFISSPLREKELILRIKHQFALIKANQTIQRRNEQLKRTIESRDRLYALIAHDLRSPIGTVKMLNDFILEEKSCISCPRVIEKLLMTKNITDNLFTLLENLLQWSQSQHKRIKLNSGIFDVAATIRQVSVLYTHIAKTKKIRLVNQVDTPVYVQADEEMIKTVIRNLLSNAIKFSYPGGKIEINAIHGRKRVAITVRDEGRGMSREELCRLKESGQKASLPGTRKESGFGLGLSLSQEFIRQNKGKFSFTSEPGAGSMFRFTLPAGYGDGLNDATTRHTSAKHPMRP